MGYVCVLEVTLFILFVIVISECNLSRRTQELEENYILFSFYTQQTSRKGL